MATSTWLEAAFEAAKNDFLGSLTNKTAIEPSKIVTVEDVYKAAKNIERQQAKTKTFRGLKRIEPLIKVLQEYSGVVDTFAQVKPDVLCLIWGGLKFLLQAASALTAVFEKIVKVLGDIGRFLPSFKQYATLFPQNDDIRRVLCLFFEDILTAYAVLLNFATDKRLKLILEPFWPSIRTKIDKIQENIEHHKTLMTANVTLEDISRAHMARKQALEEYDRAQKFRDHQTFSTIRNELRPKTYHETLADILQRTSKGSGKWLTKKGDFMKWLDPVDRSLRCLWLCGIPGAGKTYLSGSIVKRMQTAGQCILYVFISHEDQAAGKTLNVLHSLLFQALEEVPSLQPILPDSSNPDHKRLVRDHSFVVDLLCRVLTGIGPTFIVIDGLDEIEDLVWKDLLSTIIEVQSKCVEAKVLLSSREVRGIASALESHATTLRMEKNNLTDIQVFIKSESHDFLLEIERYGASKNVCSQIRVALESIAKKSDGMFLYAKLVLHVVKDLRTLPEIQAEVENLPDGLDQAYGRLISRIEKKMSPKLRAVVHKALMWIACSRRPLREEELLQALAIEVGADDFTRGTKEYRDICQTCGPIIEALDGVLRFVHFSAKEYLLDEQSNNFLNMSDAHLNAALTCITYLTYASLDILFLTTEDKPDIENYILSGHFVLLEYAALEYMEHIKAYAKTQSCQNSNEILSSALKQLFVMRGNTSFDQAEPLESTMKQFAIFGEDNDLHRSVSSAESFLTGVRTGVIIAKDTARASPKDPLTILSALMEFRCLIESMICNGPDHSAECRCQALGQYYGQQLYHCDKVFCNAFVSGFWDSKSRDQHLKMHSLAFNCSEVGCFFSNIGFRSSAELFRHMSSAHIGSEYLEACESGLAALSESDLISVLKDAIVNNQFDAIRQCLTDNALTSWTRFEKLAQEAAWYCSPEVLLWLLDYVPDLSTFAQKELKELNIHNLLGVAIEAKNIPNIKALLSLGACITSNSSSYEDQSCPQWACRPTSNVIRALRHWDADLMRVLVDECGVTLPQKWDGTTSPAGIFEARQLSNDTLEDVRRRFATIKPFVLWTEAYPLAVYFAAVTGSPSVILVSLENGGDPNKGVGSASPLYCSFSKAIDVTKLLLENGADPNKIHGSLNETALHDAVSLGRPKHTRLLLQYGADPNTGDSPLFQAVLRGKAEIAKLLLEHGADPNPRGPKSINRLVGMKRIEKYFGASWTDIVLRFRADRNPDEYI